MKETRSDKSLSDTLLPVLPPQVALRRVTSKNNLGVYASSDTLFRGAVFGRDSIEVAEDLLTIRPKLVGHIIMTLSRLQGEIEDDITEEEPGKILHEYRTTVVDGKPISGKMRQIFDELSQRWGGSETEMIYYGSVDATPHFLRLLGTYCQQYGDEILSRKVKLKSNHNISLALIAENSADWVLNRLNQSQTGLVEYQRKNPRGLLNQVWKDSNEFYVHEDGTPVNHDKPIASIEVQGLAYDGLLAAAEMLPASNQKYLQAAQQLKEKIFSMLWLPDKEYFALGVDYDNEDVPRLIRTVTANPAALLDTRIFDELDDAKKQVHITGILKKIMSPDFLTDAGIRSRSRSAASVVAYWDYHGSFVTWPKETYDIAKGLRRQGFPALARELENRLINVVLRNREYPEFVYVDDWGRVLSVSPVRKKHAEVTMVDSTNQPERTQAWTVSAVMAIIASRVKGKLRRQIRVVQSDWQSSLERQLLTVIPRVDRYLNPIKLSARYPHYPMQLIEATQREAGVKFFTKEYKE